MASVVRPSSVKMRSQRGKSPGWAAFDRKQREKECREPGHVVDHFPPVSKTEDSKLPVNNCPLARSFSTVVHPPMAFPSVMHSSEVGMLDGGRCKKPINHISDQVAMEINVLPSIKNLKGIHGWADESLIEDILAAVKNNEEQASALLETMVSNDFHKQEMELQELSTALKDHSLDKKDKRLDQSINVDDQSSEDPCKGLASKDFLSAPVEPEWEEDDVYFSCRKDAIRMMRLASQHSRTANNAFQRGDHLLAHLLSLKAQEEWILAEKLHAKAAKEILRIRNSNNDDWKLDLHGLHASEAMNILKEHLHRIETNWKRSASVDGMYKLEKGIIFYPSPAPDSGLYVEAPSGKQQALCQGRQTVLHVITGTGNHSKGQAALPTAVKSFLIENGYRFDEARPGVIAVRPKFRRS